MNRLLTQIDNRPYYWLNLFFAVVLAFIWIYILLRAWHIGPGISCSFQARYGIPCPSCGLTRAFGSILSGQITKALQYHAGSFWFFGFFAGQSLMRGFSWWGSRSGRLNEQRLGLADGILSATLFVLCFGKGYGIF